jgi:glycosyltransferase involved in cell wall biosynthesis
VPLRLLYLNHNVVGTGTYVRAWHLGRELAAVGHEVTLVTTSRSQRLAGSERVVDGVRVIEAPDLLPGAARTGWDAWNTLWRIRRLRGQRFDLIHAFDSRPAVILPALAVRHRTGTPVFMDWADWWGRGGTIQERSGWAVRTMFGPVETFFEERFRPLATAHTTIVDSLRERCIEMGAGLPDRILSLPNGCVAPPAAVPDRAAARQQLGVAEDRAVLLHLGVAFPADADVLFDAVRAVRRERPDVLLALVGRFRSAVPPDLESCTVRRGFVEEPELRLWLAAADLGVLVLRDTIASRGRWPGKLSDYLSGGLPVVMPAVGPAADYLTRAGAVLPCEPTPAGLARGALAWLDDEAARTHAAERARGLAAGELAWSNVAARLLSFYEQWSVVSSSTGAPTRVGS